MNSKLTNLNILNNDNISPNNNNNSNNNNNNNFDPRIIHTVRNLRDSYSFNNNNNNNNNNKDNNLNNNHNKFSKLNINSSLKLKPGSSYSSINPMLLLSKKNFVNRSISRKISINSKEITKDSNNNNNNNNNNNININKINKYRESAINIIKNNKEIYSMFMYLYNKNSNNSINSWLNDNLFNKEVFIIKLEINLKLKKNVDDFLLKEINRILSNKYLDTKFALKYKEIETNNMENLNKLNKIKN